ncbi:MAG: caspase family protein [Pyrinomonadaceae bacterium]
MSPNPGAILKKVLGRTFLSRFNLRRVTLFCLVAIIVLTFADHIPGSIDLAQKKGDKASSTGTQGTSPPHDPATKDSKSSLDQQERELKLGSDRTPGVDPVSIYPAHKAETQAYALIIGISSYQNLPQSAQLKYADQDAREMREFLVGEKGGFRPENVKLLLNGEATREQIFLELAHLQNLSGPDSLALIFFAGHGAVNKSGQAFLVAADTRIDDPLNTAVDMKMFNSAVQSLRSRSAVIISDACHSGALGDLLNSSGTGAVANVSATSFAEPSGRRDQSSFIFTAASPTQASVERPSLKHGLFTYYMLQGLGGPADANGDGVVTSKEVYDFVAEGIRNDKEVAGIKQVPEYNPSFDRSIPLAIVRHEGRERYRKWFSEDPVIPRLVAAFDESMRENRLTRPQGQSAWDFYRNLSSYGGTPPDVAKLKREEFLAKITTEADKLIEQSSPDSIAWDEARENLEKAYELSRDGGFKARQLFATVMFFHSTGETARAEREADLALTLIEDGQAGNPLLSVKIGKFFAGSKKWDKAIRAYRPAMSKNPTVEWITEYAEVLVHSGAYGEAEEQLRRAEKVNPNYQPALMLLAKVFLKNPNSDRLREAKILALRARTLTPDDPEPEELWGQILLATNESKLAIDSFLKVIVQRPLGEKRDQSLLFLSEAFSRAGDLDRAISALREAADQGTPNVAIYDALAARFDELGALERSVAAAQKAVDLTKGNTEENGKRLRLLAQYLERSGRLSDAAFKYLEASRSTSDGKLSRALETHHGVLLLRAERARETGTVTKVSSTFDRNNPTRSLPLIIPGGLEALERMTGVSADEADPVVLARVFSACLRNGSIAARLVSFYEQYPDFARKVSLRGANLSGSVQLPSSNQIASAEAREALKFFGVVDKNGRREVKANEFQSRQQILEALGGDAGKLQRGEPVTINMQNGELPVLRGMEAWTQVIKDGIKTKPEQQLLAFLKDPQAMRFYVAFSILPDEAIREFGAQIFVKEKADTLAAGLYFATPFLRFTPQGHLEIPGQRPGELNWERLVKPNNIPLSRAIFLKENGGALYLFCALSAAGEVGDAIARSNGFDQVFRLVEKSALPNAREPFDLMDFFRLLHVENNQLRLSKVGEVWMGSSGDPVQALLMKMGRVSPGQTISLVKQLAVLNQIERERPDWAASLETVALIARQTSEDKESALEVALDLRMSAQQLGVFMSQLGKLDALPASPAKAAAIRSFQSAFELLRMAAVNSSLTQSRMSDLTDRLLKLDPSAVEYGPQLVSFIRLELLNADPAATGAELDSKLIELLVAGPLLALPSTTRGGDKKGEAVDNSLQVDTAGARQDESRRFLLSQKYTNFAAVTDALTALEALRTNPASGDELNKLKTAVGTFLEPERPPEPKKKKSKLPIVVEPLLKEVVAGLSLPVSLATISEIRARVAPFVGEGLLGYAYAAYADSSGDVSYSPDLVRKHDFGKEPWSSTQLDANGRITGSAARLSQALAKLEAKSPVYNGNSSFAEAMLGSAKLLGRRWVTRRAEEYVARTIDLGEDVVAQSSQPNQTTVGMMAQLDKLLSSRRANEIRILLGNREISKALHALTLSELYAVGQSHFKQRLANATVATLAEEPGAVGALGKIVNADQNHSDPAFRDLLAREIRQFGMPTTFRTGLARLDLIEPEPYEHCLGFKDDDRLAERIQDVKLATIRRSHRLGGGAHLPLNRAMTREVVKAVLAQMRKAANGAQPAGRDWQSVIEAIQSPQELDLTSLIDQMSKSSYARVAQGSKWNDALAPSPGGTQKPKP